MKKGIYFVLGFVLAIVLSLPSPEDAEGITSRGRFGGGTTANDAVDTTFNVPAIMGNLAAYCKVFNPDASAWVQLTLADQSTVDVYLEANADPYLFDVKVRSVDVNKTGIQRVGVYFFGGNDS